jgi:hypothetical protein
VSTAPISINDVDNSIEPIKYFSMLEVPGVAIGYGHHTPEASFLLPFNFKSGVAVLMLSGQALFWTIIRIFN